MLPRFFFSLIVSAFFCMTVSPAKADSLIVEGDLVYDTTWNLCWSKSAVSSTKLTLAGAKAWIDELNASEYLGYNNWRLPFTPDGTWASQYSENKNVNDDKYGVVVSELGHLFYTTLQLESRRYGPAYTQDELAQKTGPFENLLPVSYWFETISATQLLNRETGWLFDFAYGAQFLETTNMESGYAIAVRSYATVPEPASWVLFVSGLLGVSLVRFRRSN